MFQIYVEMYAHNMALNYGPVTYGDKNFMQ